jgi:hypothetical protein
MALINTYPFLFFAVTGLAVWRITHLIQAEDGPFDLVVRLRTVLGQGFFGSLMDCCNCLSLWIAAPAAWLLCRNWPEWLVLWPALSGAAIFLERIHTVLESRSEVPEFEEDPPE